MEKQQADAIITEYLPKLYGFAVKRCYGYDEAEELCAQIVEEVYRALRTRDGIRNVGGYIYTVCERAYAGYVRRRKRDAAIPLDQIPEPAADGLETDEAEDEMRRVRQALAYLTRQRRAIAYAYYFEDKPVAVIAAERGLPTGTVKWQLNKLRSELKEGIYMEHKIGKLGLKPVAAAAIGHNGDPGPNRGPDDYLGDKLNLNIVYSVYWQPRTAAEIADELGVNPVFLEDRIDLLEKNGFLVRQSGSRYTTYVRFWPETCSRRQEEAVFLKRREAAELLVREYVPQVRAALENAPPMYVPGGNRELAEASAVFYAVLELCGLPVQKDLSRYSVRPTDGGDYIVNIELERTVSDPDYRPSVDLSGMWVCGSMWRKSEKYPVSSWSADSRFTSRTGGWENNRPADLEYLYEYITGAITDSPADADKFERLRGRGLLTDSSAVNAVVVQGAGSVGETSAFCILIGAVILLLTNVASWRTMISVFVGGYLMALIFQPISGVEAYQQLLMGGFAFGAVFMATDPVTSAQTNTGKYVYGLLIGAMAVIIRCINPGYPEGMMLAILLMNTFAPLIDWFVVQANIKRRLKRAKAVAN